MNIKLNIKSIIKFELFSNKSFNDFDITNADDYSKLLYCIVLSNNPESFTYDEFIELTKSKLISKEITTKFSKELKLIELFASKNVPERTMSNPENKEGLFIKDLAALLIVNAGLNADYVLNEMDLNEISLFMNAYNEKVKQEMESNRLWCYLTILPHIDSTKINSPAKLFPFTWEVEQQQEQEKTELKNMVDELPEIFKASADLIERINKQTKTTIKWQMEN